MTYFLTIEPLQIIEVDANSEEEAIQKVKSELYNQNPRNTAKINVAKEIII